MPNQWIFKITEISHTQCLHLKTHLRKWATIYSGLSLVYLIKYVFLAPVAMDVLSVRRLVDK